MIRCCARCRRGTLATGLGPCGLPGCRCHAPVQERCRAFMGSDRCEDVVGHEGDHRAMWGGGVQCRWPDDYELNRYLPESIEPSPIVHQFDGERRLDPLAGAAHAVEHSDALDGRFRYRGSC